MFAEGVNAGPTTFDGLPNFLHFKKIETTTMKTNRSTNADKDIMAMVLRFIRWFLLIKIAVIGRSPTLPVGPLPM